jgi:hypothetical protein
VHPADAAGLGKNLFKQRARTNPARRFLLCEWNSGSLVSYAKVLRKRAKSPR